MLVGWGIIDHHILGIHHVKAGPRQTALDLAFLALGAGLLAGGLLIARRTSSDPRA